MLCTPFSFNNEIPYASKLHLNLSAKIGNAPNSVSPSHNITVLLKNTSE